MTCLLDAPASELFGPDIPALFDTDDGERPKFTDPNKSIEFDGFIFEMKVERDDDMGPPWKEHDGHGPVSNWRPKESKRPGERIISRDGNSCRFYDWEKAIEIAKKDGWDAPPYGGKAGAKAARAVEADFRNLKAWCDDEWHWVGVVISVERAGLELCENAASLWGIDSESDDYHLEAANELLDEAIDEARKAWARLLAS